MWRDTYCLQAEYNGWANCRLYAQLQALGDEARRAPRRIFGGSMDAIVHHLLIADGLAMATLTNDMLGFRPRNRLGQEILVESMVQCLYPDLADLHTARVHIDRQISDFAKTLEDRELEERLAYFDRNGERRKALRWQLLTEMFAHQCHHRGQLAAVLDELGCPVGPLEFAAFLRDEKRGA